MGKRLRLWEFRRITNYELSDDGMSMRGTGENSNKSIVHMVSARAQENHTAPGQVKINKKSSEITVIPRLPELPVWSRPKILFVSFVPFRRMSRRMQVMAGWKSTAAGL
jgi:hypothetical protein